MKHYTLTIVMGLLFAASAVCNAEQAGNSTGTKQRCPRRRTTAPTSSSSWPTIMAGRRSVATAARSSRRPTSTAWPAKGCGSAEAMANNSICSPSRATMLTGKYNHLCGVRKLDDHFDGTQQTFPKLLQQAGYQTAIVGKWHLFSQPTGFDFYSVLPGQGRYYDCPLKETGQPWGDNGNKGGVVHPGYLTDVITDVALDWLGKRRPDRPFCLLIHHKAPHSPHDPAPRHKDLFKDTVFPEPSNLLDDYKGRAPEPVADAISWSRLIQNPEPQYQILQAGVHRRQGPRHPLRLPGVSAGITCGWWRPWTRTWGGCWTISTRSGWPRTRSSFTPRTTAISWANTASTTRCGCTRKGSTFR